MPAETALSLRLPWVVCLVILSLSVTAPVLIVGFIASADLVGVFTTTTTGAGAVDGMLPVIGLIIAFLMLILAVTIAWRAATRLKGC
jgi:hypothetical protein